MSPFTVGSLHDELMTLGFIFLVVLPNTMVGVSLGVYFSCKIAPRRRPRVRLDLPLPLQHGAGPYRTPFESRVALVSTPRRLNFLRWFEASLLSSSLVLGSIELLLGPCLWALRIGEWVWMIAAPLLSLGLVQAGLIPRILKLGPGWCWAAGALILGLRWVTMSGWIAPIRTRYSQLPLEDIFQYWRGVQRAEIVLLTLVLLMTFLPRSTRGFWKIHLAPRRKFRAPIMAGCLLGLLGALAGSCMRPSHPL